MEGVGGQGLAEKGSWPDHPQVPQPGVANDAPMPTGAAVLRAAGAFPVPTRWSPELPSDLVLGATACQLPVEDTSH